MSVFVLIPALPLLAFIVLALSGKRLEQASHWIGVPAVGASFALSIAAVASIATNGPITIPVYRLIDVADLAVDVELYLDPLSTLILLLVTGGSLAVHLFSVKYMIGDPRYRRFFAVMALFTFAMVLLVTSNNLLLTYMGWEMMGICSYLLISHWAHRIAACRAATKAFLVNSVADVGLGLGVVLTFATYKTLDIQDILAAAQSGTVEVATNTTIVLLILVGALGKSAQFPLHVWLPFAMEAPTPISALIHAATMVNAGPFLLIRLSPLVLLAPSAMTAIAIVGGVTALFGGLVSLTQSDIKKLLAYSTISHIGFMIFACGVGAFTAAAFHLLAHGFLKGFLFLSTGEALYQIHGAHSSEEPEPAAPSLAFGALLLACIPPLVFFAGPYEQLWTASGTAASSAAFWTLGLAAMFVVGMYTFRSVVGLFQQRISGVQGSFFSLPYALPIAALIALTGGLMINIWGRFTSFLAPALGAEPIVAAPALSTWLAAPLLAAIAGWALSYAIHRKPQPASQPAWKKAAYVALLNKLYIDEIIDVYVVTPVLRFCRWLYREVDIWGIGGVLQGGARLALTISGWLWTAVEVRTVEGVHDRGASSSVSFSRWLWQSIDLRGSDGAAEGLSHLSEDAAEALRRVEPRTLQHHLVVIVFWLIFAIGMAYWLVL